MELTIKNIQKCEIFTSLFQNIKIFTDHLQIRFFSDYIYVQGMDTSHVSLYEITIPASWFSSYAFGDDIITGMQSMDVSDSDNDVGNKKHKEFVLGINTSIFFKILSAREKTQEIHIQYIDSEKNDNLLINFINGKDKNDFDRHFDMPLVDITSDVWEIPQIEYQAEFTLSSAKFAAVVTHLKMFGDTMEFLCTEDIIKITSDSNHTGKMSVDININELTSYAIEEGGELKISYSLNYINNICQFHKICKEIEISIVEDNPMKISYDISDGAKVLFYLAPKMSDD